MIRDGLPRRVFEANTNEGAVPGLYLELAERRPRRGTHRPRTRHGSRHSSPPSPTARAWRGRCGRSPVSAGRPSRSPWPLPPPASRPPPGRSSRRASRRAGDGSTGRVGPGSPGRSSRPASWSCSFPPGPSCPPTSRSAPSGRSTSEPRFAYATAFVADGREPWHAPAGNFELPGEIDFGASIALIRRSALMDLLRAGDEPQNEAELFAALAPRGHFGIVLHEAARAVGAASVGRGEGGTTGLAGGPPGAASAQHGTHPGTEKANPVSRPPRGSAAPGARSSPRPRGRGRPSPAASARRARPRATSRAPRRLRRRVVYSEPLTCQPDIGIAQRPIGALEVAT